MYSYHTWKDAQGFEKNFILKRIRTRITLALPANRADPEKYNDACWTQLKQDKVDLTPALLYVTDRDTAFTSFVASLAREGSAGEGSHIQNVIFSIFQRCGRDVPDVPAQPCCHLGPSPSGASKSCGVQETAPAPANSIAEAVHCCQCNRCTKQAWALRTS